MSNGIAFESFSFLCGSYFISFWFGGSGKLKGKLCQSWLVPEPPVLTLVFRHICGKYQVLRELYKGRVITPTEKNALPSTHDPVMVCPAEPRVKGAQEGPVCQSPGFARTWRKRKLTKSKPSILFHHFSLWCCCHACITVTHTGPTKLTSGS